MEDKNFRKERRILGGKSVEVRVPSESFRLAEKQKKEIAIKVTKKLNYWKKHDKNRYKEAMRAIKMAEGKIV